MKRTSRVTRIAKSAAPPRSNPFLPLLKQSKKKARRKKNTWDHILFSRGVFNLQKASLHRAGLLFVSRVHSGRSLGRCEKGWATEELRVTRTTDARRIPSREDAARNWWKTWRHGHPKNRSSHRSPSTLKISNDTLTHFSLFCHTHGLSLIWKSRKSNAPEVNSGCQLKQRTRNKRNGFHKSLVLVFRVRVDTFV